MTDDVSETIGAAVRAAMQERGISQAKLGETLGVTQGAISRRLAGRIPFTAVELVAAAQLLDVPLADLMPATAA